MLHSDARARVLAAARAWIGTPFHDCASIKGVGVDCAQLLRAVYTEAGVMPGFDLPHYSPQWFLHQEAEAFLSYVTARSLEIEEREALPGDMVLYKFGRCFAHGAIIEEPGFPCIIHAYKQACAVVTGEGVEGDLAETTAGKPRPRKFYRPQAWV